jgi:hypothetical protein
MTSPGLDNRLKQHGRRAGLMVGLSMALTIALCIGAFTWIYLQVDPLTRDFVNAATAAPTKKPAAASARTPTTASGGGSGGNDIAAAAPTKTPKPVPTPTSSQFSANYRVSLSIENRVNLRPGPSVASGDPVVSLDPGTELQYLGDTENSQDTDAEPGVQWMKVRTADGIEGWILADFVEPLNAGQ